MIDRYRREGRGGERVGASASARPMLRAPRFALRSPNMRLLRMAAKTVAGAALLVGVLAGVALLALSRGPINFGWLAPEIVEALDDISGGRYDFALNGASLAQTDHGPTITVDGLVVKSGGRTILAAPRAQVSLDFLALLTGRIRPRRLEALDLDLRLSVLPDGAVAFSAGGDTVATATPPAPTPEETAAAPVARVERVALLRQAGAALRGLMDLATRDDSVLGVLDRVGLLHGRLVIDDRTIDRVINYNDVALSLDKGAGGMRFSVAATGPSRRWTAIAVAKGAPGARREFTAQLRDLSIDEIALVGGFRNAAFDTDAPISFELRFALAGDGGVIDASGRARIGHGFFRLEDPDHEPVVVDDVSGAAAWDKKERKLVISPLTFKAGGFDMALAGEIGAPRSLGHEAGGEPWRIALRLLKPTSVTPERASEKIVRIDSGGLDARFLHGERRLVFDRFAFNGPGANAALTGQLSWRDELRVAFDLDVDDTQVAALARLWPTHVAAPVRAWFIDHAPAGVLRHARLHGDFDRAALTAMRYERPPPDDSLLLEGEIADATLVEVLPGMAPLTGVSGRLRVTGRTSGFVASSGMMETAPGRRLTLTEGRFAVTDSALRPTPAVVEAHVVGNVEAAADLLTLKAVAPHASLPIEPNALKGQLDGRLRVDFEIGPKAREDHTGINIEATTSGLVVEKLIGKERLEGGVLNVVADRVGLRVTGTGRIFGAPATLDLRRANGDKGAAQAQVTLAFDEAARTRAGYVLSGVNGPINALIRTPLPVEEVNTQIELDLTRASFDNPAPGLVKPAGKPAKATFMLARRGDVYALEQFNLDAGSAQAQGVIELTREGAFRAAKLSQARLSPGDDMRVDVQRSGDTVKIVARGANFDSRPLVQSLMHSGQERSASAGRGGFDNVDVDFRSPIVTGHNKQILSNVELHIERRGGHPRNLTLTGSFGREQLALALARNQAGAPQLEISTNDGGSFLAFLDLYRKMENGALSARVQLGDNRADGVLHIRDFYVRGEPTVRRIMAQGGSARSDERGNFRFDPDSVRVGKLQSDFTWSSGRLSLREGVMSGPEIGLTFDGFIDFPRDRLDLSGSYVPAYALNSLLSNIPVLGVVLAGGQHEGIFALTYRVTGAFSAPVVNVNPLSAIAPGLMRKILGVIDGTTRMPEGR